MSCESPTITVLMLLCYHVANGIQCGGKAGPSDEAVVGAIDSALLQELKPKEWPIVGFSDLADVQNVIFEGKLRQPGSTEPVKISSSAERKGFFWECLDKKKRIDKIIDDGYNLDKTISRLEAAKKFEKNPWQELKFKTAGLTVEATANLDKNDDNNKMCTMQLEINIRFSWQTHAQGDTASALIGPYCESAKFTAKNCIGSRKEEKVRRTLCDAIVNVMTLNIDAEMSKQAATKFTFKN